MLLSQARFLGRMISALVCVSMVLCASPLLHAGEWTRVQEFKNSGLNWLRQNAALDLQGSAWSYVEPLKIKLNDGETLESFLKDYIRDTRLGWNAPEWVDVEPVSKKYEALYVATKQTYHYLGLNQEMRVKLVQKMTQRVQSALFSSPTREVYLGYEGNGFGSSSFLAIFDSRQNELLVFGTGYAE